MAESKTTPPEEMSIDQLQREISYLQSILKERVMGSDTTAVQMDHSGEIRVVTVRA
jgi:hypothetical protein